MAKQSTSTPIQQQEIFCIDYTTQCRELLMGYSRNDVESPIYIIGNRFLQAIGPKINWFDLDELFKNDSYEKSWDIMIEKILDDTEKKLVNHIIKMKIKCLCSQMYQRVLIKALTNKKVSLKPPEIN